MDDGLWCVVGLSFARLSRIVSGLCGVEGRRASEVGGIVDDDLPIQSQ